MYSSTPMPSIELPSSPRNRSLSGSLLGRFREGRPISAAEEETAALPLRGWRGGAVLICCLAYTIFFTAPASGGGVGEGGYLMLLSLPLKVLPALLLSGFARRGASSSGDLSQTPLAQFKHFVGWGLLASALGDLLLDLCELPSLKEAAFIAGLASFLLAHVCYAAGFFLTTPNPVSPLVAVACVVPTTFIVSQLSPHILNSEEHRPLFAPVCVYIVVICVMWYFSLVRSLPSTSKQAFWLTAGGATAFLLSDTILAFDRFTPVLRDSGMWFLGRPKLLVMVTYYTAQCCIAAGAYLEREGRQRSKSKSH
jgi:alkenylglycerophosphocholine/alkenylglycerophosphoethanolamine hydrolase